MRSIVLDNEAVQALADPHSAKHRAVVAQIQRATSTGVADAHIGATVRSLSSTDVVVLTSDPAEIAAVCSSARVTIVNV